MLFLDVNRFFVIDASNYLILNGIHYDFETLDPGVSIET